MYLRGTFSFVLLPYSEGDIMGVKAVWDNEQHTIVRYDLSGRWTWDEFFIAYEDAKAMLNATPHAVHFILNPTDAASRSHLPPGIVSHIGNIGRARLPNAGITVAIGSSNFVKSLVNTAARLYPRIRKTYQFVETLDDARALLAEHMENQPNT
jgi:hypothetical protein